MLGPGGGGLPRGRVHNLLMQFFNPDSSKIEVFETFFFDIVTTQNDISSYAKPLFFFTLFGCWVGPKGRVHNLFMQFFNPDSSKIEVFETCFFDIVTTQNDISNYAKHVLGRIYVFSPYLGVRSGGGGGGLPKGRVHNLLMQFFNPGSSKIEVFETCFFDIVTT